jgi:hypothetical protein
MFRADLCKSISRNEDVLFGFESKRAAIGMPALKNKLPSAGWEKQGAFLLDHGDALAPRSVRKCMRDKTVQEHAAG